MSSTSNVLLSPNSCVFSSPKSFSRFLNVKSIGRKLFVSVVRVSSDDPDCNDEECAPKKEVGTVSMEWLAGENTKVVGTYPPRKPRGWTGYVEKDTAGQTNVYSIEPAVYVAESAISSSIARSSSDGAENTTTIVGGLALIAIDAASSILLQVGKDAPTQPKPVDYDGPSLSYYINKFKPSEIVQATAPALTESPLVTPLEAAVPETPPVPHQETSVPETQHVAQQEASVKETLPGAQQEASVPETPPVALQETSLPKTMASETQLEEAYSIPTMSSTS